MSAPFRMVDSPPAMRDLAARLKDAPRVAVDTEFTWERTYYARLGLVQLGLDGGDCFLVDPLAFPDLGAVGEVLADGRTEKILHDAPQDLMILRRATGAAARRVFDTRLAAGFAGLDSSISLGKLLEELLGLRLEKAHTRANWLARPLAPAELDYAADDVRHLPDAADRLRERARAAGAEAWMDEEMAAQEEAAATEEKDAAAAYLRIRAASSLSGRPLAALRELAAWREEEARRADLPRRWVLEDGELAALAAAMPERPEDLRLPERAVRRWGDAILAAVRRAREMPETELPPLPYQPRRDAAFRKTLDAAMEFVRARAAARGIDPALVCSRSELARRLQDDDGAGRPLWRGWRADLLGAASPS